MAASHALGAPPPSTATGLGNYTWGTSRAASPVVLDDGSKYVCSAGIVSQVSGANTYYYLADGLGSTMKTVDATGTVVHGYTYPKYLPLTSSFTTQTERDV